MMGLLRNVSTPGEWLEMHSVELSCGCELIVARHKGLLWWWHIDGDRAVRECDVLDEGPYDLANVKARAEGYHSRFVHGARPGIPLDAMLHEHARHDGPIPHAPGCDCERCAQRRDSGEEGAGG